MFPNGNEVTILVKWTLGLCPGRRVPRTRYATSREETRTVRVADLDCRVGNWVVAKQCRGGRMIDPMQINKSNNHRM